MYSDHTTVPAWNQSNAALEAKLEFEIDPWGARHVVKNKAYWEWLYFGDGPRILPQAPPEPTSTSLTTEAAELQPEQSQSEANPPTRLRRDWSYHWPLPKADTCSTEPNTNSPANGDLPRQPQPNLAAANRHTFQRYLAPTRRIHSDTRVGPPALITCSSHCFSTTNERPPPK